MTAATSWVVTPNQLNKQTAVSMALVLTLIAAAITGAAQFASLSTEVGHLGQHLGELKNSLQRLQEQQASVTSTNASAIALVLERMQQDDQREKRDTAQLKEHAERLRALEAKVNR